MVDAQQRQHRRVEVMHAHDIFDGSVAEFVRAAPGHAGLDAAAGHEDAEGKNVMISSAALPHRGASEFTAPEDEGVLEQSTLGEIRDECGSGTIRRGGAVLHSLFKLAVVVPGAVIELNHAHAALGEAAGEEAVRGKGAIARFLDAVKVEGGLALAGEIGQLRNARLHFKRHLVLGDARRDFGVVLFFRKEAVETLDLLDDLSLRALADTVRIADVVHRVALRLELDSLEPAREHAAAPLTRGDGLLAILAGRSQDDEAGEVLRFGAEAVLQPRPHARAALDDGAGVHEGVGSVVVDLLGLHRADHAELVGLLGDLGEEIAHFDARLAVLREIREGSSRLQFGALELGELLSLGERLGKGFVVEGFQVGLPVEGFELGGASRHAEEDDALRFHREVRCLQRAVPVVGFGERARCGLRLSVEHGHGHAAETVAALQEEGAPVDVESFE